MGVISKAYDKEKVYVKIADILDRPIKVVRVNLAMVDETTWNEADQKFDKTGKQIEKFFIEFVDLDGKTSTVAGAYKHILSVLHKVRDTDGLESLDGETVKIIKAVNVLDKSKTHYTLIDVKPESVDRDDIDP